MPTRASSIWRMLRAVAFAKKFRKNCNGETMKAALFRVFVAMSLVVSLSSMARSQTPPSAFHEEAEDRRQEDIVTNMHFADSVLKQKFLVYYVPYQEKLFKVDHQLRDLVKEYLADQANGQIIPGPKARELLGRGVKLQNERNEILSNYINQLKKWLPGGVALQAWIVENK